MEDKKDIKVFFCNNRVYRGYIDTQDDSHFFIYDVKTGKIYGLPKAGTTIEEVNTDD